MEFTDKKWLGVLDVWLSGQTQLPRVPRWQKYAQSPDNYDFQHRTQDDLQHSYSVKVLGLIMIWALRQHVKLDTELILTCLLVHDHGEGELKRDIASRDSTDRDALEEYHSFRERFEGTSGFNRFHYAYLLQRCGKDNAAFPKDAEGIVWDLESHSRMSAYAFEAIERWDYIMYALEQWTRHGNPTFLVKTLRNQMDRLDNLAGILPGFSIEVWTPEIRAWCTAFLAEYEGQFIEGPPVN